MTLCEPRPLDLKPYQDEYRRNRRRYRRAIQEGKCRQVHQLEHLLLRSHSAKALAIAEAAKKKKYPLYPAKLDMTASMLSCWEDPIAPAKLYFKKKPGGDVRSIFKYGVFGAAQQYLVLWVLEPRLRLHEGQYAVPGRDRTAAVEKAKEQILKGYELVIRGDIKNCYPSMNGDRVLELLPGPCRRPAAGHPAATAAVHHVLRTVRSDAGSGSTGVTSRCGLYGVGGSGGVGASSR